MTYIWILIITFATLGTLPEGKEGVTTYQTGDAIHVREYVKKIDQDGPK